MSMINTMPSLNFEFDNDKYRRTIEYITKESGCNTCPICNGTNVINSISVDNNNVGLSILFDYSLTCNACKKSFVYKGKISAPSAYQVSLVSYKQGEYSFNLLISMLTQAREQIEKKLHDMEDREVEIN